ncbi:MAG TPA: hypothetical protein VGU90_16600 [Terriglobales bacterium]|nr:hypothetical protein [Terriglobales bacterium]
MRKLMLVVLAAAGLIAFSANALGQAASEAVLTHSISTSIGTHVGTALGNATNQLAGKLGQQTSTAVPRQVITTVKPGAQGKAKLPPATTTPQGPSNGSLIASIQGGEPKAATCTPAAKPTDIKAQPISAPQKNCQAPGRDAAHPAVVNLPAPQ